MLRVGMALVSAVVLACSAEPELPRIASVPEFRMTDHRSQAFSKSQIEGRVWVANFMFTSCPDVCPVLTRKMVDLRKQLEGWGERVQFVSFSVDPVTDTPAVLQRYAAERGAEHANWAFVTGPLDEVKAVVVRGFKQSMEPKQEPGKPFNVLHGSHFVLVDQTGSIRGYYASDEDGLGRLALDTARLLRKSEE